MTLFSTILVKVIKNRLISNWFNIKDRQLSVKIEEVGFNNILTKLAKKSETMIDIKPSPDYLNRASSGSFSNFSMLFSGNVHVQENDDFNWSNIDFYLISIWVLVDICKINFRRWNKLYLLLLKLYIFSSDSSTYKSSWGSHATSQSQGKQNSMWCS